MVKAALLGVAAACAACSPFGGASVFNCETDAQCAGGICQPENVCSFADSTCTSGQRYGEHAGSLSNTCVGGDTPPDAPPDEAPPSMCTPNAQQCFAHAIETCRADGMGFDAALRMPCPLTCVGDTTPMCVAATNIAAMDQATCNADGMAPALTPPAGATVTFAETEITCTPTCGTVATIPRTTGTPSSFYCLSRITIPAGVTFAVAPGTTSAITLFSTSDVSIASDLSFDGGDATGSIDANQTNDLPGAGGPGGFTGGALANQNLNGTTGQGPCAGGGGTGLGAAGDRDAGGGGGGAHNGNGGTGGDGREGAAAAAGGSGGTGGATCSAVDGKPLVGGSGGGSGADGACGAADPCGWPGGGGGGALHIVSRTKIGGTAVLSASGGDGYGSATGSGGGGGGGAGGFILLEAPTLEYTGALRVDGGAGGRSDAIANGGAGATGATENGTSGTDSNTNDTGGPGGGGGGGRIRINAATGASCATASPSGGNTCTTGALRATP